MNRDPQPARAGWGVPVLLALVAAGFSVFNPALIIFVPLAFMLLALPPRKPWLMLVALVLLAASFAGQPNGDMWWYGRGWVLILGAWFVLAVAFLPAPGVLPKALIAVAGTAASAALLFLADRPGWQQFDWTVGTQLRTGAVDVIGAWTRRLQNQEWATGAAELTNAMYRFADFQANNFPALLAIGSLAGLSVAWWLWRRLSVQDARPLAPLREFRFRDELVWLFIIGAALVVLPLEGAATRTGTNLLTFMAALYAVRGLAVMVALFGVPGFVGLLFGALIVVMLYPIVMAMTLMLGLTDTWLDLRARRLKRQDNEKH